MHFKRITSLIAAVGVLKETKGKGHLNYQKKTSLMILESKRETN